MGTPKEVNYYTFAENDYNYLKNSYERGDYGNAMTYIAQCICERFLKHIINVYCQSASSDSLTDALHTHSIRKLKLFLNTNLPAFTCDWNTVLQVNGFYFSARYPGDDSFFVEDEDITTCMEAVEATKRAVDDFISNTPITSTDIISEIDLQCLNDFDK